MALTDRQIDVAYVLEGVAGVRDVYAVAPPTKHPADATAFAVHLEPGGRALAAMHYALLRVLTHEECAAVRVFTTTPSIAQERLTRIVLSPAEREAARARVPIVSAALAEEPLPTDAKGWLGQWEKACRGMGILIVGPIARAVIVEAFGEGSVRTCVDDADAAFAALYERTFHLVLCDALRAFGPRGLLARVREHDEATANAIVVVADPRRGVQRELVKEGLRNCVLERPVTVAALRSLSFA